VNSFITVLFHAINFALFISICVYFFKRYASSYIRRDMAAQDLTRKAIVQQIDELSREQALLEQTAAHQEAIFADLQAKVDVWQRTTIYKQEALQQDMMRMQQSIQIRAQERQRHAELVAVQRQVMPKVREQAYHILEKRFSHKQAQQDYHAQLMNLFTKGSL